MVLATHFLGEAGRLADRMAVLHRGRLRAFGQPDELAAQLWSGVGAELDLGRPGRRGDRRRPLHGARACGARAAHGEGARLVLDDRDALPRAVAAAVDRGVAVYGAATAPADPRGRLLRHRAAHRRRGGRRSAPTASRRQRGRAPRPAAVPPQRDPTDEVASMSRPARPSTGAIRTIVGRDLRAVRRSKAIILPMVLVPLVLLVLLPLGHRAARPQPPPPTRSRTCSARRWSGTGRAHPRPPRATSGSSCWCSATCCRRCCW